MRHQIFDTAVGRFCFCENQEVGGRGFLWRNQKGVLVLFISSLNGQTGFRYSYSKLVLPFRCFFVILGLSKSPFWDYFHFSRLLEQFLL